MEYNFKSVDYKRQSRDYLFQLGYADTSNQYYFKYIPYSNLPALIMFTRILAQPQENRGSASISFMQNVADRVDEVYGKTDFVIVSDSIGHKSGFVNRYKTNAYKYAVDTVISKYVEHIEKIDPSAKIELRPMNGEGVKEAISIASHVLGVKKEFIAKVLRPVNEWLGELEDNKGIITNINKFVATREDVKDTIIDPRGEVLSSKTNLGKVQSKATALSKRIETRGAEVGVDLLMDREDTDKAFINTNPFITDKDTSNKAYVETLTKSIKDIDNKADVVNSLLGIRDDNPKGILDQGYITMDKKTKSDVQVERYIQFERIKREITKDPELVESDLISKELKDLGVDLSEADRLGLEMYEDSELVAGIRDKAREILIVDQTNIADRDKVREISSYELTDSNRIARDIGGSSLPIQPTDRIPVVGEMKKEQMIQGGDNLRPAYIENADVEVDRITDYDSTSTNEGSIIGEDVGKPSHVDREEVATGIMYEYNRLIQDGYTVQNWELGFAVPETYDPKDPFNAYYPWAREQTGYYLLQNEKHDIDIDRWEVDKGIGLIKCKEEYTDKGLLPTNFIIDKEYSDFKFYVNVRLSDKAPTRAGVVFDFKSNTDFKRFTLGTGTQPFLLEHIRGEQTRRLGYPMDPFSMEVGQTYRVGVTRIGARLEITVDGRLEYDMILE